MPLQRFRKELTKDELHPHVFRVCSTVPASMLVDIPTIKQTIDLSDMKPESGHGWVLIALGEDGAYATECEEVESTKPYLRMTIKEPGNVKLAAVLLKARKAVVNDGPYAYDIMDLRMTNKPPYTKEKR